jgi:hypothetical protein
MEMTRSTDVNAAGQGTDAPCQQRNREARGTEKTIQKTFGGSQNGRRGRNGDRETILARGEKERLAGFELLRKGITEQAERMAAELRQCAADGTADVARGEKERLAGFELLMKGIREQAERMAAELRQCAAEGTVDVARGEKERLADFDLLMKNIKGEVDGVCKFTHELLEKFGVERHEMMYV